ncbi:MAG: hypothetical protein FWF29_05185 [Treponema sp.]|nr:hypothetical protein [Treponema sp.]
MGNEQGTFDPNIIKSIRSSSNKDSNAYKATEYYMDLISGILDEGGIIIAVNKIANIEKYLLKWKKNHPINSAIIQPEENALCLINDLKNKGII